MLTVLEDLVPAKFRKYVVYILIPLIVVVYGVWKAVGGDWDAFWPALVPAIIGWLVAAPNTHPGVDASDEDEVTDYDDAESVDLSEQPDPQSPAPASTNTEADEASANAEGEWNVNDGEDYR